MNKSDWTQASSQWLAGNLPRGRPHIPVFDSDGLAVKVRQLGNAGVLCRSGRFDNELATITDAVRAGFTSGVEGMLYCLYVLEEEQTAPVYVGIASANGKAGNLSSLFASVRKKPRFDDYDGYHIGDLSTQVVPGYVKPKAYKKVWADRLFANAPSMKPLLRTPVYFWGKAWDATDTSVAACLRHTPLFLEEHLLVHAFRTAFPGKLLNA